jgi:CDP-diglyceride synthetase
MASIVSYLPYWGFFIVVFLLGVSAAELGGYITRRRAGSKEVPPAGTLVGALLGLLAFMLGFTFSITSSRFSNRKQLVVDQANAIGTCYLRTDLLPDSQKIETKKLLGQYVDELLETSQVKDLNSRLNRLDSLNMQIWKVTSSLKDKNMDPPLRSLYTASINSMIDLFGERKTVVFVFRIPGAIWAALFLLYLLSMFVVGSEIGSPKGKRTISVPVMTAAFALIVVLIADMDTTDKPGRFSINQKAMVDVQNMIKKDLSQYVR